MLIYSHRPKNFSNSVVNYFNTILTTIREAKSPLLFYDLYIQNSLIFWNYLIFLPDRNDNLLLGKLKTVSITAPLCLVYFPQFQQHKFCIKEQRDSPCYRKWWDRIPFNLLKTNLCNNSFLGSNLFSLLVDQRPPAAMWWAKRSNVPVNDIMSISKGSNRCLMAFLTVSEDGFIKNGCKSSYLINIPWLYDWDLFNKNILIYLRYKIGEAL